MTHVDHPRCTSRIGHVALLLSLVAITLVAWLAIVQGQQPATDAKVLYVVEYVHPDKDDKSTERLLRLTLKADGSLSKDVVLTARRYFFGDVSKARIVNKRYIVTEYAGVIDFKDGKLLLDQGYGSELLGVEGDKVVYRVHNLLAPDPDRKIPKEIAEKFGDWSFDLVKGTRTRAGGKPWSLSGTLSPDRGRSVFHGENGKLWLDLGDANTKLLGKEFTVTHGKHAENTFARRTPFLWLDNERILTQQGNGKIVIVSTQGVVSPVCVIADAPATNDDPRLSRDAKKRIIYQCGRSEYVIDVDKKSAAPLEEYALGHGFETPVETGPRGLRTITFEGKATGGGLFVPADVRTGPEVIAVWNLGDGGSRRYVGVLWTKLGFAWRGLDVDYCGLIGWAE